jgi:lactoylglutathione lyase
MSDNEFPAPQSGFVITHFLVVSDQDRSREFYRSVFGATVVAERDPVILKIANSWLILNVGGGPTDDKPAVTLAPPAEPDRASAFLNIRVADIAEAYAQWSAKGAQFLTEPKDHAREIRAYIRDPDGHPDRSRPDQNKPELTVERATLLTSLPRTPRSRH